MDTAKIKNDTSTLIYTGEMKVFGKNDNENNVQPNIENTRKKLDEIKNISFNRNDYDSDNIQPEENYGCFDSVVSGVFDGVCQGAGLIWNLPNTVVGLSWGLAGYAWDHIFGDGRAEIGFGNNAIEFHNHPAVIRAITLGNTISYADNYPSWLAGDHERAHTIQGEILGPLYLPANIAGGTISEVTSDSWHGNNFMEEGPMSRERTPF